MTTLPARTYRLDVARYERMVASGILTPEDKVELLEGVLVKKMSLGSRHAARVKRINQLFNRLLANIALVGVQDPIRLDFSEPEPDLCLLRPRPDFYESGHPTPADVLLIVEVADSTVRSDRTAKLPIYARNSIAEVWLLDVERNRLEIYTQPVDGAYRNTRMAGREDIITLQLLPQVTINAAELL